MGTTPTFVAQNYTNTAIETRKKIEQFNGKFLAKQLNESMNLTITSENLDMDLGFEATANNYTSLYQAEDKFIFVVQNPSQ